MRDIMGRAPFDQNATRAAPVQRMPAIVDDDLPDMGRMTARLLLQGKTPSSPATTKAERTGR